MHEGFNRTSGSRAWGRRRLRITNRGGRHDPVAEGGLRPLHTRTFVRAASPACGTSPGRDRLAGGERAFGRAVSPACDTSPGRDRPAGGERAFGRAVSPACDTSPGRDRPAGGERAFGRAVSPACNRPGWRPGWNVPYEIIPSPAGATRCCTGEQTECGGSEPEGTR
jgi:hypothetical protein